ncbi:MAG: carbohydrate kinase, partial [Clostridia bacterium]|nr:carbohydrate kinase [Clostridia bacterium]
GANVTEIRAMGGGANSGLWCQMKADLTKKTLVTLENNETACLGGAILAGVGIGLFKDVESVSSLIKIKKTFVPSGVDYSKCYENYLNADAILNVRK